MTKKILESYSDYFYLVFRVIIGLMFLLHGLQKMPGIINGNISLFSFIGLAGIIELIGGALITIGLFTNYVALITAIEMLFAYFMAHAPNGLNPIINKGEPALLFFGAFLVLIAFGSRKFALDNIIK